MNIKQTLVAGFVAISLLSSSAEAAVVTLSFAGIVDWRVDSTGPGIIYNDPAVGTTGRGFLTFDTALIDTTNAGGIYGVTTIYGNHNYYGPASIPGASQPNPLPISAGAVVASKTLVLGPNDYFTTFGASITKANPTNNRENDAGVRIDQAFGTTQSGYTDFQYVWLFTYDSNGSSTEIFDFDTFLANPVINWNATGAITGANIRFSETEQYHLKDVQVSLVSTVPEPESYDILLGGIALIGLVVRKRKQKQL